jgi:peptidyl-Lys metalloendopeptidase
MYRAHRNLLIGSSLLLLAAVPVAHAADLVSPGLRVRLEVQRATVGITEAATILYTLHNDLPEDVSLVYWQTPLRGILSDFLEVRLDGQAVDYIGPIVEWATPEESDFISIPAGGELSVSVDLSAAYDMSRTGEYSARYRVPYLNVFGQDATTTVLDTRRESNVVTFWVDRSKATTQEPTESSLGVEEEATALPSPALAPDFVDCSPSRQVQIKKALVAAKSIANQARRRLSASTAEAGYADKNYRTWFGCYDVNRYATVKRRFDAIFDTLSSATFTYHCDEDESDVWCKDNPSASAYVFPDQPYHVHLCKRFWKLPLGGLNSRTGSLLHETSHFLGTVDVDEITTVDSCKRVVKLSPEFAVKNACGYQYFAESRPVIGSSSAPPKITKTIIPILDGSGTWYTTYLYFTNEDCAPIVLIENRTVSSPGNWVMVNWPNPTLFQGTWREGVFAGRLRCTFNGHGWLGPHIMETVLVDAVGHRSKPETTVAWCYKP